MNEHDVPIERLHRIAFERSWSTVDESRCMAIELMRMRDLYERHLRDHLVDPGIGDQP